MEDDHEGDLDAGESCRCARAGDPRELLMLGLIGTVLGLAIMLLRIAVIGLLAYGAFKLIAPFMRGPSRRVEPKETPRLGSVDPYYQAAMRELDVELPEARA